jgi:hypothetical protein
MNPTDGMRCEKCQRKPDNVAIMRHHALGIWRVTVTCHGESQTIEIKAPPLSGKGGFNVSHVRFRSTGGFSVDWT